MAETSDILRLISVDPDELVVDAKAEHQPVATWCLISGGHDSTVLAHRCRQHYERLAFIDTGTALPGVRDFVGEYAAWIGKPLRVLETDPAEYNRIVLGGVHPKSGEMKQGLGFPGPMQHTRCYVDLKERQIERLTRESKAAFGRMARVMMITGVRRGESARRRGRAEVTRRGSTVFVNPLIDWSDADMRAYRQEHELPESEVSALMHKSGECNCGAFARPGEREDLRQLFPTWFAERIAPLERAAAEAGLPCAVWGAGRDLLDERRIAADAGALCSDCQLRFEVAA